MKVILDTSFILSAIRNKIDIFEELREYNLLIPEQVLNEIKSLENSKAKTEAKLALKIIQRNKSKILKIEGKNTDNAIINYAKNNPQTIIATLDREIKRKTKNPKIIIRNKKKLEII